MTHYLKSTNNASKNQKEIEDGILSEKKMCKLMDEFCVIQGQATPDQTYLIVSAKQLDGF